MKNIVYLLLGGVLAVALSASALAQDLGEAARQARSKKQGPPAGKVYDNDNLPQNATINVGAATVPETAPAKAAEATAEKPKADGERPPEPKKAETELKAAFADAKRKIAQLEREIDVAQREYRMRGAVYYADAGTKLRNQKQWMDEQRKSEADLAARQKALDQAKQTLEDMREVARKAGLAVE
jgi:hypothetical protein